MDEKTVNLKTLAIQTEPPGSSSYMAVNLWF